MLPKTTKPASFKFTLPGLSALQSLSDVMGINKTAVLETLIRKEAENRGIKIAADIERRENVEKRC